MPGRKGLHAPEQEAGARDILRDRQRIHALIETGLGKGRADTIAGDQHIVLVGGPCRVAQRHEHGKGLAQHIRRDGMTQPAAFNEAECDLHGLLLSRRGRYKMNQPQKAMTMLTHNDQLLSTEWRGTGRASWRGEVSRYG